MDLRRTSKRLSWLLRHGAHTTGLPMDAAGWAPVAGVLAELRIPREVLEAVVAGNDKRRLELQGDRVRAVQGHSLAGTPVTADALEASWREVHPEGPVFHGTRLDVLDRIRAEGLRPMDRTHVHLAAARDATVGKRANVAVLLVVSPPKLRSAGVGLFESPNGVLLAREVPADCIVGVEPVTRRARRVLG